MNDFRIIVLSFIITAFSYLIAPIISRLNGKLYPKKEARTIAFYNSLMVWIIIRIIIFVFDNYRIDLNVIPAIFYYGINCLILEKKDKSIIDNQNNTNIIVDDVIDDEILLKYATILNILKKVLNTQSTIETIIELKKYYSSDIVFPEKINRDIDSCEKLSDIEQRKLLVNILKIALNTNNVDKIIDKLKKYMENIYK